MEFHIDGFVTLRSSHGTYLSINKEGQFVAGCFPQFVVILHSTNLTIYFLSCFSASREGSRAE